MDAVRWREVRKHFEAAVELEGRARADFVAAIADPTLRADVERLLATQEKTAPFDQPAAALAAPAWVDPNEVRNWDQEQIGRRCGAFRLERLLGAGGMGTVYVAKRVDGRFDQTVAIKLVLAAHHGLRERFAKEQQILAGLRHPNIAQLIDGGEADDGIPYFAMEYVDGRPITEYCHDRLPDAAGRVRLMLRVAAALSHAHRSLVIHRDIKPSNILVTDEGHPKLLDFGIAKLLGEGALGGLTAQRIGPMTPEYAAPEQFRGGAITAATDVYQFGMLLFRLIAARWPYNADPADLYAWGQAVVEQQPITLSRALQDAYMPAQPSPAAARRARERVRDLGREGGRDLDAIVRRALAKDPFARYGSVDAMAADLSAFLEGRPVQARRGGAFYVGSRFVARHRLAVGMASAAILGLVGITGYAVVQARAARHEAERARAAVRFVQEVFRSADPSHARAGRISAEQMLDTAAGRIAPMLAEHPDLRGPVTAMIANVYLEMGAAGRALPLYERALADLQSDPATPTLLLAATLDRAAYASERVGQLKQALVWLGQAEPLATGDSVEAVQIRDGIYDTRSTMGRNFSDFAGAEHYARASLANAKAIEPGGSGPLHQRALLRIARVLKDRGNFAEAESTMRQSLDMARQLYGDDDYRTLQARQSLGWVLSGKGDYAPALAELEPVGERFKVMFGERSTDYATNLYDRALVYQGQGQHERALAAFLAAADGYADAAALGSSQRGWCLWSAGGAAYNLGRYEQALGLVREAEVAWKDSMAPDAATRGSLYHDFADVLNRLGQNDEADIYSDRSLAILRKTNPGTSNLADALELAGKVALARGDGARARAAFDEAQALVRKLTPDDSARIERLAHALEGGSMAPAKVRE